MAAGAQTEVDKDVPTRALNDDDLFVRLQGWFDYRDGMLFWKPDPDKPSNWNKRWPGTRAGNLSSKDGYRRVGLYGKAVLEHRLIYAWHHGPIQDGMQIDHIDGDRTNNRIENLRLAKASQNAWNRKRPVSNASGLKGVSYIHRLDKYKASIRANGVHYHLGCFATAEDAHAAYVEAASRHHGEFACGGRG